MGCINMYEVALVIISHIFVGNDTFWSFRRKGLPPLGWGWEGRHMHAHVRTNAILCPTVGSRSLLPSAPQKANTCSLKTLLSSGRDFTFSQIDRNSCFLPWGPPSLPPVQSLSLSFSSLGHNEYSMKFLPTFLSM